MLHQYAQRLNQSSVSLLQLSIIKSNDLKLPLLLENTHADGGFRLTTLNL